MPIPATSLPDRLQAAIGDGFTIVRELGRGGMATVFLAEDRRHKRQVAIKVVHPDLGIPATTERFEREIQIAASLNHPHIVNLFDSGFADGLHYYIMPFVEGESLRDRLKREPRIPVDEAIRLAGDVAGALQYAHDKGLIHRDIKPENMLLSGSEVFVTDFGIARPTVPTGSENLTATGIIIGTPTYMSPEQATGSGSIDTRSDIYSLGCVLYEMLVGHPPFAGRSTMEVLAKHALEPAPSVQATNAMLSDQLQSALHRALAKEPADRFASAGEFGAVLDEIRRTGATRARPARLAASPWRKFAAGLAAIGAIAVLVFGWPRLFKPSSGRTVAPGKVRIAVLPLRSIGQGEEERNFAAGLTDEITFRLAKLASLSVVARNNAIAYGDSGHAIRDIGRDLEVDYVVQGSIQWQSVRGERRVRIIPNLVRVADGTEIAITEYTGKVDDVFASQAAVAQQVAERLPISLGATDQQSLQTSGSQNPEAYREYALGRALWQRRTAESLVAAVGHFEAALRLDSLFARAHSGLADSYVLYGQYGVTKVPPATAWLRARQAAERALALDSTLAEAHASLGEIKFYSDWDWPDAERRFKEAIRHDPDYATAHQWYAELLALTGRPAEAIDAGRRAVQLDPVSAAAGNALAMAFLSARKFDDAITQLARVQQIITSLGSRDPLLIGYAIYGTALALAGKGDSLGAMATLARIGDSSAVTKLWIRAAIDSSYRPTARRELARLAPTLARYPLQMQAQAFAAAGDANRAIPLLEQLARDRTGTLPGIKLVFLYDPIRGDPRFQALLRRLNLPQP